MASEKSDTKPTFVKVGIGTAISRLIRLNHLLAAKVSLLTAADLAERDLLIEALDQVKLDLHFDCNGDSIPDTIEVFQVASSKCCRIVPGENTPKTRGSFKRRG